MAAGKRWLSVDYRVFDPIVSMLEPDTLSSQQYFDRWRGSGCLQPEKRLMLAVMQEAVECFQENVRRRGRKQDELFKKAEDWFFDNDMEWPFSFLNICEAFGFEPSYFRSGLLRWKKRALSQACKLVANSHRSSVAAKLPRPRKLSFMYGSSN